MKFEKTQVWGFEHALRGMRAPLESWDKSDSEYRYLCTLLSTEDTPRYCDKCGQAGCSPYNAVAEYVIGPSDMNLAQRLIAGGPEHRKFLRQVFVSVDITAPLYWWKEFDTYKIGTVANSTSTMHKLATTPITLDCFEIDDYNNNLPIDNDAEPFRIGHDVSMIVSILENLRKKYLETKNKKYWKELVRWLPESWLQTRTITMNYENLRTIYHQRKDHKLNEWSGKDDRQNKNFIAWVESLPYAKEFIIL